MQNTYTDTGSMQEEKEPLLKHSNPMNEVQRELTQEQQKALKEIVDILGSVIVENINPTIKTAECEARGKMRSLPLYAEMKNISGFDFLSAPYDTIYNRIERARNLIITFGLGAVPILGPMVVVVSKMLEILPPIAIANSCVNLMLTTAFRFEKVKETAYICSACFSFAGNVMADLLKVHSFYNEMKTIGPKDDDLNTLVKTFAPPSALGNITTLTYKFTYFLLKTINFSVSLDKYGPNEYMFIYNLLSNVDFTNTQYDDNYNKNDIPSTKFCYSTPTCQKIGSSIIYHNFLNIKLASLDDIMFDKATNFFDSRKRNTTQTDNLKSNCSEFTGGECMSFNDILMRMFEYVVYTLIATNFYTYNLSKTPTYSVLQPDETCNGVPNPGNLDLYPCAFRNLLRKFIKELNINVKSPQPDKITPYSTLTRQPFFNSISDIRSRFSPNKGIVRGFYETAAGTPEQNYRMMLREFTIISAHFSTIVSRYNIHFNEYNNFRITKIMEGNNETIQEIKKIDGGLESANNIIALLEPSIAEITKPFSKSIDPVTNPDADPALLVDSVSGSLKDFESQTGGLTSYVSGGYTHHKTVRKRQRKRMNIKSVKKLLHYAKKRSLRRH